MTKPLYAINIHFLRNRLGLTAEKAAATSNIPYSSWRSYEEGRAFPHYTRLLKLCQTLQYYDIISLISRDLANDKSLAKVDTTEAMRSLQIIDRFLKQQ